MVVGRPMTLPTFNPYGKELLLPDCFKYTGSFFADDRSMSREMVVRNVRALAAFRQFQDISRHIQGVEGSWQPLSTSC
eukprot:353051-Chlamydomonas_euryale.AAC.3